MATSGTVSGSGLRASWKVNSQNQTNNTTSITVTFTATFNVINAPTTISGTISVGGVSKTFSVSGTPGSSSVGVGTITAVITHNADGTGGARIKGSYTIGTGGSGSCNSWVTFDTIPRQATLLTAPNFNDEENPTITYTNPAGDSVAALEACISLTGAAIDISYRSISKTGTSYTFNLTEEERRILRAATDGSNTRKVKFFIQTTLGETKYRDWKEVTYTIINGMPEIESSVIDVNTTTVALTGDEKKLVKYFSNAKAYMNMVAYKEAYFTAYYIENGSKKINNSYSHTFNAVESNVFNFYVADNRNNAVSQSYTATMVNYVKLTCNYNAEKLAAKGDMTVKCSGNYFNGTFGAVANTLTVQYRYKAQGGTWGSWNAMTATKSGNTYSAQADITGLDYRTTYVFQCRAIDKLITINSAETTIQSFPVFHWSNEDFTFEVPVTFNAGASMGQEATAGTWTPTLNIDAAAIQSHTVRRGWYSKIGNVVTIGWQIKATLNNSNGTTVVSISGCPFTPAFAAFGGGVAHNVYLSGGFNFECWCIGTDGNITMRAQPCNNTAAGNLNISSSAYYPTGTTQVITLGGTITFME